MPPERPLRVSTAKFPPCGGPRRMQPVQGLSARCRYLALEKIIAERPLQSQVKSIQPAALPRAGLRPALFHGDSGNG